METGNVDTLKACIKLNDDQIFCPDLSSAGDTSGRYRLGKEQELALLFLDVRDYTSLMEKNNGYDVLFVVRHFLNECAKILRLHGGQIVEVAGDSIYAAFGTQTPPDAAVQSAHAAAVAVLSLLDTFNSKHLVGSCRSGLEAGIGIHKGKVVVGLSDLTGSEQVTVMGLAANVAARIQAETKTLNNNLLISADAFQLLPEKDDRYSAVELDLRGISQRVKVYLLGKPYKTDTRAVPPVEQDLSLFMAIAG
ncbi:adenylate/guanylate cyclase domain-containing protein [Mucilaginibacter pallidiroseus]|uniref:Adenylate/guanylate cyclase domain-containing protein n=1 Tax=Mucilaginibacter pallidiroseus TaxID=2599295 RepID=A0A563TYD9_9SPHI|nr:adenylate/guanylate cyclase domain-containing protein [Mucilaginibacter pallidiroseus]TWR24375.1 adenylate/guanylate cyclase domain-containing protein [Mucilaginibacter pallidiroseus]